MKNIDNLGRWFLSVTCIAESLFFGYLAYLSLGFDTTFYGHFISRYSPLVFLSTAALFLYVSSALLRDGPRARYMSAILFLWAIVWLTLDAFTFEPRAWQELLWAAIPGIAFGILVLLWSQKEIWNKRLRSW